jgi:hypothetical protein
MSVNSATNETVTIPNWSARVGSEQDPNNREIIAYLSGKEDGRTEEVEKNKMLFFTNLEMCCYYSTKFYQFIKENGAACDMATIKAESIDTFYSLFIVPIENYKEKAFRELLFKQANDFRKALKIKDVCLEFSVLPVKGDIDKSEIYHDGFIWEYDINGKAKTNS